MFGVPDRRATPSIDIKALIRLLYLVWRQPSQRLREEDAILIRATRQKKRRLVVKNQRRLFALVRYR